MDADSAEQIPGKEIANKKFGLFSLFDLSRPKVRSRNRRPV